jgi:twitching motility protein PilT
VICAPDGSRFRFNISRAQHGLDVAFRHTANNFKTLSELHLPENLSLLSALKDGLVIIAGPAGAGKSTTLATLLDLINQTRCGHIITIEDPIEFIHQPDSCLVSQRQVGIHTSSFNDALVAAVRQDPDIIMVGEMRDQNTIRTAITAAETGHLVFTTLHAADSIGAVERLLSTFSPDDQNYMRRQLAGVLRAIVAQHLLHIQTAEPGAGPNRRWPAEPWNAAKDRRSKADRRMSAKPAYSNVERRKGRVRRSPIPEDRLPACEVLIVTPAIANLIATGQFSQVYSFVESGTTRGMQTLDQDLARLCVAGKITETTALAITRRPKVLQADIAHLVNQTRTGAT